MRVTFVCVFSLLIAPWASATFNSGTVLARGDVTIDGKRVDNSGSIFSGEVLKTGANGAASITTDGVVASAGSRVELVFGSNQVNMECGWLNVVTVKQFAVQIHDITVTPKTSNETKYEIRQSARVLSIHDFEGEVEVNDGKEKTMLEPGQTRTFDRHAACVLGVSPWVPAAIFGASTWPIWLDRNQVSPQNRRPITPAIP